MRAKNDMTGLSISTLPSSSHGCLALLLDEEIGDTRGDAGGEGGGTGTGLLRRMQLTRDMVEPPQPPTPPRVVWVWWARPCAPTNTRVLE